MEVLLWFYDREMGRQKESFPLIMTGIALLIPVLCIEISADLCRFSQC